MCERREVRTEGGEGMTYEIALTIRFEGEWVAVCDCNPWGWTKEDTIDLWNKRVSE